MSNLWKYQTKSGENRYRVKFHFKGQQVVKSGFTSQKEAQAWGKAEKKRLKEEGELNPGTTQAIRMTFSALSNEYLTNANGRKTAQTITYKKNILRHFFAFIGSDIEIETITRSILMDFMKTIYESKGEKSANRYLRELSSVFNYGINQNYFSINPCRGIEKYSIEEGERYVPPKEDVFKVLMVARPWERELLEVFVTTGARLSEILNLTWDDVNLERNSIRFWTRKRKNGNKEARIVSMGTTLSSLLRRKWDGRENSSNYVFLNPRTGNKFRKETYSMANFMPKLCEKAGVKPFTFHCLRHYVSTRLADSGKCSLYEIQRLLGHQRSTTTEGYLRSLAPDLQKVAEVLDDALCNDEIGSVQLVRRHVSFSK